MIAPFRRFVACLLTLCTASAHAGMIPTEALTQVDRARILGLVERAEVQAQLAARGVGIDEVRARVAALTEEEAAELAARIDSAPAGGIGILSAILVVFLVLLITDILGFTKVFPFTKPMR